LAGDANHQQHASADAGEGEGSGSFGTETKVITSIRHESLKKIKHAADFLLLLLPLLYLAFLVADRYGVWDHLSGLDLVEHVAARFESSYGPDAARRVKVGDREWDPLIALIYKYSHANLPKDRAPKIVARWKSVASAVMTEEGGAVLAQWTAPTTPFAVVFNPKPQMQKDDLMAVGTLADLRDWIQRAKDDRRFWVQDVFLAVFGTLLGFVVFGIERRFQ
jgi:hypothetical protein